jgi:hypothetical protein
MGYCGKTRFIRLRIRSNGGSCEHGNDPPGSEKKFGGIFE